MTNDEWGYEHESESESEYESESDRAYGHVTRAPGAPVLLLHLFLLLAIGADRRSRHLAGGPHGLAEDRRGGSGIHGPNLDRDQRSLDASPLNTPRVGGTSA